ncbi:MAG: hypothetical protein ABMB14_01765, partial [Myxococcota bacterium]
MVGWSLAIACAPEPETTALRVDGTSVASRSRPLAGGRIAAAPGWLVASDEDGDRLVALGPDGDRVVTLPSGWAPGAVATDGTRAAVVLGGLGAVGVVELAPLRWRGAVRVCAEA